MAYRNDVMAAVSNRLTLLQAEALLLIEAGRKRFSRREARSVEKLVDLDLVTARFDISAPDPLRGRVHEIWNDCTITARGVAACEALRMRFAPLMTVPRSD